VYTCMYICMYVCCYKGSCVRKLHASPDSLVVSYRVAVLRGKITTALLGSG